MVARRSCHAQQKISWTRAVDLRHRTARRAWRLTGRRAVGWTGDGHRYDHRRADKTEPGKRLHSRHALHHAYQHGLLTLMCRVVVLLSQNRAPAGASQSNATPVDQVRRPHLILTDREALPISVWSSVKARSLYRFRS